MAYPPELPPSTRAEATLMTGNHAPDHNLIAAALGDIVAELGADPSGTYADVSARIAGLAGDVADAVQAGDLDGLTAALIDDALSSTRAALDARYALAGGAVGSGDIADGAVTEPKLATGAVNARVLGDLSVDEAALVNAAVSNAKLADSAVTLTKVAAALKDPDAATAGLRTLGAGATQAAPGNDARFTNARTPTGPAGGALAGTYPNPGLAADSVGSAHIAANAVGTSELADSSVTAAKLAPGAVDTTGLMPKAGGTFTGAVTFAAGATLGDGDSDVTYARALEVETHTRNVTNSYTGGKLTGVVEKDGAAIVRTTTLTYTGEQLTQVTEVAGGKTITTTLAYTGSDLTGTTRTVA